MTPTWLIIISTIFSCLLASFIITPFIAILLPLFGVYGNRFDTLHGKFVVGLIFAFPFAAISSFYIAWTSNGHFALVPFVHFSLLFIFRIRA